MQTIWLKRDILLPICTQHQRLTFVDTLTDASVEIEQTEKREKKAFFEYHLKPFWKV